MKLIVYIIALVAIVGAAVMSMNSIGLHEEQLNLTKAKLQEVVKKQSEVADMNLLREEEEAARDDAQALHRENIATKEVKETEKRGLVKQSASFDPRIEELLTERERINQVVLEIERELQGINVPLAEVETFVTNLENEKKDLDKENTALEEEIGVFSKLVDGNKGVITDFKNAQIKRRNNLNANKVSSLITAVDNEWGFVVVKPHAGSQIKAESKLVVIRGNKHIGRLNINAIETEAGRVLANIDYSSLVPGMRIRPGDRVILSEPLTQ